MMHVCTCILHTFIHLIDTLVLSITLDIKHNFLCKSYIPFRRDGVVKTLILCDLIE